jgi:hypothetical protein
MARPKKVKVENSETKANSSNLIEKLEFISLAQVKKGNPIQTHCVLSNGFASATDGVISAGCQIEETLESNPCTFDMINALKECKSETSITCIDGYILFNSGNFKVKVNSLTEQMPTIIADPICLHVDNKFKEWFEIVAPIVERDSQRLALCSVHLKSMSMVSTNNKTIIEVWHGVDIPSMILPKRFVSSIMNCDKTLSGFGYSGTSCTFHYSDGCWIKTQLRSEAYPNTDGILNAKSNQEPVPESFFEALKSIEPFSNSGNVYFENGSLQSHRDKIEGASYEVLGVRHGPCYNIKELLRIKEYITEIDFYSQNCAYFFGPNLRGVVAGVRG